MRFIGFALALLAIGWSAAPQESSVSPSSPSSSPQDSASAVQGNPPKLDLTPGLDGKLSQEQMRELTRTVAQNYRNNYQRERDYTFIERDVENSIDGNGDTKSTEIKTFEVLDIYGEQVRRLIERRGQATRAQKCRQGRRKDPEDHRQT